MDDFLGISMKRLLETILAILAMVFFLIENQLKGDLSLVALLSIIVASYLIFFIILGIARRADGLSAGGSISLDAAFGVLLLLYNINALTTGAGGRSGLTVTAIVMDMIVGALFVFFAIF